MAVVLKYYQLRNFHVSKSFIYFVNQQSCPDQHAAQPWRFQVFIISFGLFVEQQRGVEISMRQSCMLST